MQTRIMMTVDKVFGPSEEDKRNVQSRTLKALRRLGGACEVDELLASERAKLAEVKGRVDRRHGKEGNGMSPTAMKGARGPEASG